jgi:cation diffusion facilitator family transporter
MLDQRYLAVKKANNIGGFVNLCLAVIKISFGIIGNSSALLADGIHSFSDLLTNAFVWIASSLGQAAPDENHPYGHRRFETLGCFSLGFFLIAVALFIAYEGIEAIIHRHFPVPEALTAWVAVISIIANESVFRYSLAISKKVNSNLLKGNAYHSRADSLSSILVLIGILGALAGFPFCDDIAAVLVAGFILKIGIHLSWQAVYELSDASVDEQELRKFQNIILNIEGVRHMHRLRTRKMADKIFLDVHVLIAPYTSASEGHYIGETVRYHLMKTNANLDDVTVHIDTEDHPETMPEHLLPGRKIVEAFIFKALEPKIKKEDVARIDLFYFEKYLEIGLLLKAHLLTQQPLDIWKNLIDQNIHDMKQIKKINIAIAVAEE